MPWSLCAGGGGAPLNLQRTSFPCVVTHHSACAPSEEISIGLSVAWKPMPRMAAIITSSHRLADPHAFKIMEICTATRPGACRSLEILFFLTESSRYWMALSDRRAWMSLCASDRCVWIIVAAAGTTVLPRSLSASCTRYSRAAVSDARTSPWETYTLQKQIMEF